MEKPTLLQKIVQQLRITEHDDTPQARIHIMLNQGMLLTFAIALVCMVLIVMAFLTENRAVVMVTSGAAVVVLAVGMIALLRQAQGETDTTLTAVLNRSQSLEQLVQSTSISHEYLNNVLMSMAGSLMVIGPDATIKLVNQATLDLTGFKEADLLGKPIDTLLDSSTFSTNADVLSKGGFVRHGERTYQTHDGQGVAVSFSSAVMRDKHKRVRGIVCVAQDISAIKKLEHALNERVTQLEILHQVDEELTHSLSSNYVLTMALDVTMRLSGASAGALALFQEGKLEPVLAIGYPASIGKQGSIDNGVISRVARQQRAELVPDVEQDADYIPVLISTRALILLPLISQNNLLGVLQLETSRAENFTLETFRFMQLITSRIAVALDNASLFDTSRHQVEELRNLYTQVSALEQIKTDMIRMAAHDLRNPLSNMALTTRLLRRTMGTRLLDEDQVRIKEIERAIERMQQITTNILSLERINETMNGEITALINLQTVIEQAFEDHLAQADRKSQGYTLTMPDTPLYVLGDGFELLEAAANFISNAIKYTPEHGKIEIVLEQVDQTLRFEVRDNGFGIPKEQQERLFQPFYRVRTAETAAIDGTGLGLHLVKQIIERHKGVIRFSSTPGSGSVFGFELPLVTQTGTRRIRTTEVDGSLATGQIPAVSDSLPDTAPLKLDTTTGSPNGPSTGTHQDNHHERRRDPRRATRT